MISTAVLAVALAAAGTAASAPVHLPVPVIRQAPERCGPAALAMVLRYYGADAAALAETEGAYDPVLKGSLITDLAAAARRAGYTAEVAAVPEESLRVLLRSRVPPVLLYGRGTRMLPAGAHYGVLVGWNPEADAYTLNDGGRSPRTMSRAELLRRWRQAGGLALVVRPASPAGGFVVLPAEPEPEDPPQASSKSGKKKPAAKGSPKASGKATRATP
ncbi:MAG TPA: cysteine peptidase family C39 domain-containing protein [Candidatus Eisenbacteria bacterium]|nr:cysteine peptidase family C39 domain-containing protein [Candidatus Eisenbacteria bacterium]